MTPEQAHAEQDVRARDAMEPLRALAQERVDLARWALAAADVGDIRSLAEAGEAMLASDVEWARTFRTWLARRPADPGFVPPARPGEGPADRMSV